MAEWLDAQGLVWKYEGPAYGNQHGQYLPDFQITGLLIEGVPHALYFDVKPPGKEREQPGLIGRTLNKEECGFIGVEDFYHWDRMFWLGHEPWRCPACDHRGFDPISPWVSPQYRRYQQLTGQSDEPS